MDNGGYGRGDQCGDNDGRCRIEFCQVFEQADIVPRNQKGEGGLDETSLHSRAQSPRDIGQKDIHPHVERTQKGIGSIKKNKPRQGMFYPFHHGLRFLKPEIL